MTASLSVQEKQSNFLEKYISSAREKLKGYEYYKFQFVEQFNMYRRTRTHEYSFLIATMIELLGLMWYNIKKSDRA